MQPRLTRSQNEKIVAGVCGGLGEYFGVDPVIVRLIFVVLVLTTGVAIIAYPVLWAITPQAPAGPRLTGSSAPQIGAQPGAVNTGQTISLRVDEAPTTQYAPPPPPVPVAPGGERWRSGLGIGLIGLGIVVLASQLGFHMAFLWPIAIIALGVWVLRKRR
jgi:phage shock protein C